MNIVQTSPLANARRSGDRSMRSASTWRRWATALLASVFVLGASATAFGQAPGAPENVTIEEVPSDNGTALEVHWHKGADVATYNVLVSPVVVEGSGEGEAITDLPANAAEREWAEVGLVSAPEMTLTWNGATRDTEYYVKVVSGNASGSTESQIAGPFAPQAEWFRTDKLWIFFLGAVICFFIIFFISSARRGKELFVRKLAGLDAVDEAIGRATEMGRSILYVPGIMDMNNVQTLAGLTILGHTAKMVAEYDTELNVPVSKSLVMTAGREVVKQSYTEAGRPDGYNDDMVHYLTDEQFGYVAGVNGIIVRDEPATCIYMGAFYAESLILAETGNSAGAIQIAGTAMPSQLPFFVAACDYTLIGEELFAASAYLSKDPKQLGSLKGQDVGKAIAMVAIAVGSLAATFGSFTESDSDLFDAVLGFLRMIFH